MMVKGRKINSKMMPSFVVGDVEMSLDQSDTYILCSQNEQKFEPSTPSYRLTFRGGCSSNPIISSNIAKGARVYGMVVNICHMSGDPTLQWKK